MLAQSPVYIEMHITKIAVNHIFPRASSRAFLQATVILHVYSITLHNLKLTEGFETFIFMGRISPSKYLL
jgi:hypothetical protein